ncbi:hypothetical protein DPM19_32315 [Actinomadura craniellae]|uniref:Uncharacterized protein n=1 Tax=Actinomadura craniellae TaxID=2231787 RepID=A0A365GW04_9ACTN|nr:hypothetical protein [Actinomadura craniellae]RAY10997.1 hypothetical protein DPM19_32315 [Actinomadura craniellae]
MPADSTALLAHAHTLGADADALAECAVRLRDLAARLRAHDAAPPWLYETMNAHITACVVASTDLAEAAARMRNYADLVR